MKALVFVILAAGQDLAPAPASVRAEVLRVARSDSRGQGVETALDRATRAWAAVRTATGTFEQTVTNSLVGRSVSTRAKFEQRKPGHLAVTFDGANGGRIVADGKHIWAYLPSTSPDVIRSPIGGSGAMNPDLAGRFLDAPRSRYTITDAGMATIGGRRTQAVTLTPKPGQHLGFEKVTVWIDREDGVVRQFETIEGPITRRIRFVELTIGGAVNDASFRFTPPKGAKVVDRP